MSPSGSDSNPCSQSAPCLTFDRAYHVARPGQTVAVAGGTYPSQTVTADPGKSTPAVMFRPLGSKTGATPVRVANLIVEASNVEFDDMITGVWTVGVNSKDIPQARQTHDVVLRNLDAARFFITGASHVSVLGGSVGPSVDTSAQIRGCYLCTYVPQDVVIDGVTFHDFTRATAGVHMQCLQVYPAQQLVVRNSRFTNCAIMDLFLSNFGNGGDLRDIVIENNVFDKPGSHAGPLSKGYYPLAFAGYNRTITNVRITYNSMLDASVPGFDSSAKYTNIVISSNVGPLSPWFCLKGVTYSYNVWTAAKCSPTDSTAPTGFTDPEHLDLHLVAGAAAIGHGDPNQHPLTDIDDHLRPTLSPSDAGAYQRETALIVLGRSIGSAAIGDKEQTVVSFYGQAADTQTVRVGGRVLRQSVYGTHGGNLWVTYAGGTVVGVGTSSRYYQTAGAVRATASMRRVRALPGVAWIRCRGAYRRYYQGVPVYFAPKGGRSGITIGSISMMKGDGAACS